MIAKAVYDILSTDPVLQSMGVDISPLWTDIERNVPMVTYMVEDDYVATKTQTDTVRSEIHFMAVSDQYIEMQDIVTQIVVLLDKFSGERVGVKIRSIDVEDAAEERDKTSGLYIKTISFVSIWNL